MNTKAEPAIPRRKPLWLVVLLLVLPALLVVAVDIALRGNRLAGLRGRYIFSYGAAVLESAVLWGLLLASASAPRGFFRWIAAGLFVLFATLAMGGQIYFHSQYFVYLNLDATLFGTSVLDSLFGQLRADSYNFVTSVGPVLLVAVVMVYAGRRLIVLPRRATLIASILAPVVAVAVFLIPVSYRSIQASTPDMLYFHAIGGLFKQLSGERSQSQIRPKRRTPPPLPSLTARPPAARNVLFILTEGLRAEVVCAAHTDSCPTMPRTNAALPQRIALEQMRSNTSTTASELAVLFTGLSPTASREALHSAPSLFDFAHAAGIDSAYWTSHHMMFANSRLWVLDLPTRFQCGATQLDPVADIDIGANDTLLTARVKSQIVQLREPFFAIVQYGNTHMPYLIDPADAPFEPYAQSRAESDNEAFYNYYKNAVYLQDKTIAELIEFVRRAPFGPRTIILHSSDHGEQFREHNQLGHTQSLYEAEILVPSWIDAPAGTLSEGELEALRSYRQRRVFHSDLVPTIIDLMGLGDEATIRQYREKMVGSSLLRPNYVPRTMALTNCTGVWGCAFENWGVMRGSRKVIARQWDPDWLCYDVSTDPAEKQPIELAKCQDLVAEAVRIYGGLPGRL